MACMHCPPRHGNFRFSPHAARVISLSPSCTSLFLSIFIKYIFERAGAWPSLVLFFIHHRVRGHVTGSYRAHGQRIDLLAWFTSLFRSVFLWSLLPAAITPWPPWDRFPYGKAHALEPPRGFLILSVVRRSPRKTFLMCSLAFSRPRAVVDVQIGFCRLRSCQKNDVFPEGLQI